MSSSRNYPITPNGENTENRSQARLKNSELKNNCHSTVNSIALLRCQQSVKKVLLFHEAKPRDTRGLDDYSLAPRSIGAPNSNAQNYGPQVHLERSSNLI